ncbi:MAG: cation diffusion facilitator family transporter, partial [Bacteroidales bacterium]|nr:cation diffusion facilitator family transporter [Bacteroidales bacterium]
EGALSSIPVFAIEIPLLGSLASILGIFFGAIISGIIGAIVLNLINKTIESKQKNLNAEEQYKKKNEILSTQNKVLAVAKKQLNKTKLQVEKNIIVRHQEVEGIIKESSQNTINSYKKVMENLINSKSKAIDKNEADFDKLFDDLENL